MQGVRRQRKRIFQQRRKPIFYSTYDFQKQKREISSLTDQLSSLQQQLLPPCDLRALLHSKLQLQPPPQLSRQSMRIHNQPYLKQKNNRHFLLSWQELKKNHQSKKQTEEAFMQQLGLFIRT